MANQVVTDRQILQNKWTALDAEGNPTTELPAGTTLAYAVVPPEAGSFAADPSDASGLTTLFTPTDAPGNLGTGIQLQISAGSVVGVKLVDVVASAAVSFGSDNGVITDKP